MTYGIVICSYRYGHLAAHAIETVLSQTFKFDKIWFVDDGAGDCKHLPSIYGERVEFVLREQNLGIIDNFNDMLNRVDTDYVMFLGADNWLRSDALNYLKLGAENMGVSNPAIVCYDITVTGELKEEIHDFYKYAMNPENGDYYWNRKGGHHGSMLYKTEIAKGVGGYAHNKTSGRTDEDQNLWDKITKLGYPTIHLQVPLLYYRRHKENFNKY